MPNNSSEYVFNLEAIVFGGGMLFFILCFHAVYMFYVESRFEKMTERLVQKKRLSLIRPVFYVMGFVLTLSHLIEIYIWGKVLSFYGLVPNAHQAMIFAGSAYTTVGYGTNPLPASWDLVMVVIALSGMVTFGWSISVLSSMVSSAKTLSKGK